MRAGRSARQGACRCVHERHSVGVSRVLCSSFAPCQVSIETAGGTGSGRAHRGPRAFNERPAAACQW